MFQFFHFLMDAVTNNFITLDVQENHYQKFFEILHKMNVFLFSIICLSRLTSGLCLHYEEHIQRTFLNMVRMNPFEYQLHFGIEYACPVHLLEPIHFDSEMKQSTDTQMSYLLDPECPFDHSTCFKYCYQYESCSLESRVKYFCRDCLKISENIMKGTKNALTSLHLFLGKDGHCNNIFDVNHNVMAVAYHFHPNIYLQTFAHRSPTTFFTFSSFIDQGCFIVDENENSLSFYINYIGQRPVQLILSDKNNSSTQKNTMNFLFPQSRTVLVYTVEPRISIENEFEFYYFSDGEFETFPVLFGFNFSEH